MSERDAFGREVDGESAEVEAQREKSAGPPKWLLYMVAFDALVIAIVAIVLLT